MKPNLNAFLWHISVQTVGRWGRERNDFSVQQGQKEKRKRADENKGTEKQKTGIATYISLTQTATPSTPVPWHYRDMANKHTLAVYAATAVNSTWHCLSVLTRTSILCPGESTHWRSRADADPPIWTHVMPPKLSAVTSLTCTPCCKHNTFSTAQKKEN